MHSFLKSIGFSDVNSQVEINNLVKDVLQKADTVKEVSSDNGTRYAEYKKCYAQDVGVTVCGEKDEKGNFHFSHMFPFIDGGNISCSNEEVFINKKVDSDSYTGMIDDSRVGVSLIFFIQNVAEYLEYRKDYRGICKESVSLAALAREGKIILPTEQRVMSKVHSKMDDDNKKKVKLIEEAKKGDPGAIDALTMNDIDRYAAVTERIKHEDLFSIVDTSFIPFGSESDVYSILCNIVSARQLYNTESGERIWQMNCICNGVALDICINDANLLGVPMPGMRFRGNVWMQGRIEFLDSLPFS